VPEICSTILIAALDDEILNAIGDAIPGERFQLLAARGWGSLASLGDRSLAAAVVHHQLGDIGAMEFCARLRAMPGRAHLPILMLLPAKGRPPNPGEPFSIAMKFPCGPAVLLDNIGRAIQNREDRVADTIVRLKADIEKRLDGIAEQSYYEILGIPTAARRAEVTDAFDAISMLFHPDHLRVLDNEPAARRRANEFYLQASDAYQVLTERKRRKQYDAGLVSGRVRWRPHEQGPEEDEFVKLSDIPECKKHLKKVAHELRLKQKKNALMWLEMAMSLDPENTHLRNKITEVIER
jgi:hypothetical protein